MSLKSTFLRVYRWWQQVFIIFCLMSVKYKYLLCKQEAYWFFKEKSTAFHVKKRVFYRYKLDKGIYFMYSMYE